MHWLPQILRLLPSGGVLLSDNVLQDGDIVESRYAEVSLRMIGTQSASASSSIESSSGPLPASNDWI